VSRCWTVRGAQNRGPRLFAFPRLPPALEAVMVIFSVSPPCGIFFATTFMHETFTFSWASHVLQMMTSLPLPLSVVLGYTMIFYYQS
jgi:hypothetical protein